MSRIDVAVYDAHDHPDDAPPVWRGELEVVPRREDTLFFGGSAAPWVVDDVQWKLNAAGQLADVDLLASQPRRDPLRPRRRMR